MALFPQVILPWMISISIILFTKTRTIFKRLIWLPKLPQLESNLLKSTYFWDLRNLYFSVPSIGYTIDFAQPRKNFFARWWLPDFGKQYKSTLSRRENIWHKVQDFSVILVITPIHVQRHLFDGIMLFLTRWVLWRNGK